MSRRLSSAVIGTFCLFLGSLSFAVQQNAPSPQAANTDPTYQALRHVQPTGGAYSVNNFVLKRDAGTFTFTSGTFYLLAPVNGKVTGAVFTGSATFALTPPTQIEKNSLKWLTKQDSMLETFSDAAFRFTDGTEAEIKKAGTATTTTYSASYFDDVRASLRKPLHYNLDGRILEDVLSSQPGGLFVAFLKGEKHSDKEIYAIDPHGVSGISSVNLSPEEIAFITYGPQSNGVWAAFHYSSEPASAAVGGLQQNALFTIRQQKLSTDIDSSGFLRGDATTTLVAQADGLRVLPFDLFGELRVSSVSDASGQPLAFIQENEAEDPGFYVVLTQPLSKGASFTVHAMYAGKNAVQRTGDGDYFPAAAARYDWYPNVVSSPTADFAEYEMTFNVPKGMEIAASGSGESNGNGQSTWKTDSPVNAVGFSFGKMKKLNQKQQGSYAVAAYANTQDPDFVKELKEERDLPERQSFGGNMQGNGMGAYDPSAQLGSMDPTRFMERGTQQAEVCAKVYSDYFGAPNGSHVALTEQTVGDSGASWPQLTVLPFDSFFDITFRRAFKDYLRRFYPDLQQDPQGYYEVVVPHEVARQWWGATVGAASYRDQWMTHGFADFSASLVAQSDLYNKFSNDELALATKKNAAGYAASDFPVTLGTRAETSRTGKVASELLNAKGAYILQMLRMMMLDPKTGDAAFKSMMQDFVTTYRGKPATTEDFKAIVEKHMLPAMNFDGNGKMDWFFNEFVYGSALPHYTISATFTPGPTGIVMNLKLTQSGVDENFKMPVPLYLIYPDNRYFKLGTAKMVGDRTLEQTIPLGKLQEPQKVSVTNFHDVFGTEN